MNSGLDFIVRIVKLAATTVLVGGLVAGPIEARRAQIKVISAPVTAGKRTAQAPRYAAILVDAKTHEILYATAADEARHPASITKIMTLYLAFDAISAGRLKLSDAVTISSHAASQKPSRLGLAVGKTIPVEDAIKIVAVKSANDLAVALAEKIGGTEDTFVAMMNRKARSLGMRNTVYANASGLPNPYNVTTARDIALLSVALMQNHPDGYEYFSLRDASFGKQAFTNHNRLLGKVMGVDGIKTGYTVDAGYTLAASAMRNGRRLVAVVLGEPSINIRNRDVTQLLEAGFTVMRDRTIDQPVEVAALLPAEMHPAFRYGAAVEQGSRDEAGSAAKVALTEPQKTAIKGTSASKAAEHPKSKMISKRIGKSSAVKRASSKKSVVAKKATARPSRP